MSSSSSPSTPSNEVAVQLLDSALGRVVRSWKFSGQKEISIGRAPENDVQINDPYVSRLHAHLQLRDGQWILISRGRSGVVIRNQQITEVPLKSEGTFQLGSAGPVLRFGVEQGEELECGHTLCFDVEPPPSFALDESKLDQEVGQIINDDYFRKLQTQARMLRAQRHATVKHPA